MMNAIEVERLIKRFPPPPGWGWRAPRPSILAVDDVSFQVRAGELFGLLGPNGAGKTTLVKMLCTLITPTAGSVRIAGFTLAQDAAIRRRIGFVPANERSFYWRLTARQNLAFFAHLHDLRGIRLRARVDAVLADVDMTERADDVFGRLSSGMKQRVAVARSLLHDPELLFLDEPTRSLDPVHTAQLHDLIQHLVRSRGMTTFLITHNMAEAEKLCGRVAMMHNGRIRALGTPHELAETLQPFRDYRLKVSALGPSLLGELRAVVPSAAYEAPTLRFRAVEQSADFARMLDALHAAGVTVHQVDVERPTLETLFAQLTRS